MNMPTKLYHATYKSLLSKIKSEGLGGKSAKPNWEDSKQGVTYWAISEDIAYSYAESAENVPEEWLDEIIIFECDIDNFDLSQLFEDETVLENDGSTVEYHKIMPFDKLRIVELY